MSRDLLEPEFGTYSSWLVDAISELAPADRIPAACRGTGRPALLENIARLLRFQEGARLLDIGSGLGGPAAWVTRRHRCKVICLDVMELEVGGSLQLFPDLCGVVGSASELPLRTGSMDAAWALGVVEMVPEREQSIGEVARVLKSGARFAIYGFFTTDGDVSSHPSANLFDRPEAILEMFEGQGLQVVHASPAGIGAAPEEWCSPVARVRTEVRERHAGEPELREAESQLDTFNRLRSSGQITDWVMVGEKVG